MKPYNTPKTKKEEVQQMFDNIAPSYDNINHILSLSIDKLWRRRVVKIVKRLKPQRVMDTGNTSVTAKPVLHAAEEKNALENP